MSVNKSNVNNVSRLLRLEGLQALKTSAELIASMELQGVLLGTEAEICSVKSQARCKYQETVARIIQVWVE